MSRRTPLALAGAAALLVTSSLLLGAAAARTALVAASGLSDTPSNPRGDASFSLTPPVFWPLPVGAVKPRGWLLEQSRIQRRGLAGHLALFWEDVANSTWLGGNATESGGIHERLPYWLNGMVPLAFQLDDADDGDATPAASVCAAAAAAATSRSLLAQRSVGAAQPELLRVSGAAAADVSSLPPHARARAATLAAGGEPAARAAPGACAPAGYSLRGEVARMLRVIVAAQDADPDGWLGGPGNRPAPDDGDQYWVGWDVAYALMQYAEAAPAEAPQMRRAVVKYALEAARRMRGGAPLAGWSAVRWPEWVHLLLHALDTFPSLTRDERAGLRDAAQLALEQGFDWRAYYTSTSVSPNFMADAVPFARAWTLTEHGVNNAMALKDGAVAWRLTGDAAWAEFSYTKQALLDRYHGLPTGVFSADECLAGREPNRGVELCVIVEAAFSLGVMARFQGDGAFAERAEAISYNALPGAMSDDMWSHNYLSQMNEVFAGQTDPHPWVSDPGSASIYGLAPTYGCCTANHVQGWPKHVQAMLQYATQPAPAVVVAMWGPVEATMPAAVGGGALVTVETEYPWGDDALVTVVAAREVLLQLRVPSWAHAATVTVGDDGAPAPAAAGEFFTITCAPGRTSARVNFRPAVRVEPGWGAESAPGLSVFRGALLFALPVREEWRQLRQYAFQAADWEVRGDGGWNYALALPPPPADASHAFAVHRSAAPGARPFAAGAPRVWLTVRARRLRGWRTLHNTTAAPLPLSPVDCDAQDDDGEEACGPEEEVALVPFGNTRLRTAVLPWVYTGTYSTTSGTAYE